MRGIAGGAETYMCCVWRDGLSQADLAETFRAGWMAGSIQYQRNKNSVMQMAMCSGLRHS